jgi:hypothetical protein
MTPMERRVSIAEERLHCLSLNCQLLRWVQATLHSRVDPCYLVHPKARSQLKLPTQGAYFPRSVVMSGYIRPFLKTLRR